MFGQKNSGSKTYLGPKKFSIQKVWVQKYYGSKNLVGPKKIESEKYFESKIFGPPPSLQHRVKLGGLDGQGEGGWDGGSSPWL